MIYFTIDARPFRQRAPWLLYACSHIALPAYWLTFTLRPASAGASCDKPSGGVQGGTKSPDAPEGVKGAMTKFAELSAVYLLLFLALLLFASPTLACPVCHSQTGLEVRQVILGESFWFNIGVSTLPFLVVGLVAAGVSRYTVRDGFARRTTGRTRIGARLCIRNLPNDN